MLEIQGAVDLLRLANSTFFIVLFNHSFFFFSDLHRMGHGPLRRHLLWQKVFLPRPETRNFIRGATHRPRLGQTLKQRLHRGHHIRYKGVDQKRAAA